MPSGTLFALLALQRCPKGANVHIYSQPDSHSPQQSPSWATDMSGLPAAGPSVGYTKDQLLSGPTMAAWSQSVLGVGATQAGEQGCSSPCRHPGAQAHSTEGLPHP